LYIQLSELYLYIRLNEKLFFSYKVDWFLNLEPMLYQKRPRTSELCALVKKDLVTKIQASIELYPTSCVREATSPIIMVSSDLLYLWLISAQWGSKTLLHRYLSSGAEYFGANLS